MGGICQEKGKYSHSLIQIDLKASNEKVGYG